MNAIDPYRSETDQDVWMRKQGLDPERVRRLAQAIGSSVPEDEAINWDDEQS